MGKSRNFSFTIQKCLLDQIQRRADIKGETRNAEMRRLVFSALENVEDQDCDVTVPPGLVERGILWLPCDVIITVEERARRYGRAAGRELERLLAYAIEENTRRDLAILSQMLAHRTPLSQAGL